MNNAAMHETATLCHDMLENSNAILPVMSVQLIPARLEGMPPDFTFSSEPSSTLL